MIDFIENKTYPTKHGGTARIVKIELEPFHNGIYGHQIIGVLTHAGNPFLCSWYADGRILENELENHPFDLLLEPLNETQIQE